MNLVRRIHDEAFGGDNQRFYFILINLGDDILGGLPCSLP